MPTQVEGIDHRLRVMEGQIRALRAHLGDADRTCLDVAQLLALIDGAWRKIRAQVLREYVQECLVDLEGVEEDDRVQQLLEAIERIAAR